MNRLPTIGYWPTSSFDGKWDYFLKDSSMKHFIRSCEKIQSRIQWLMVVCFPVCPPLEVATWPRSSLVISVQMFTTSLWFPTGSAVFIFLSFLFQFRSAVVSHFSATRKYPGACCFLSCNERGNIITFPSWLSLLCSHNLFLI